MRPEILSKLLPKTSRLEYGSPVTGESLTSSDCAMAMGMLPGEGLLSSYGRLAILGQTSHIELIAQYVYERVKKDWKGNDLHKRKTCRPGLLNEMIYIAIAEEIAPNNHQRICGLCKGQGERMIEDELLKCERCGGTGRRVWSEKEIAKKIGVSYRTFRRAWQRPYNHILDILRSLDGWFIHELNQVFSDKTNGR